MKIYMFLPIEHGDFPKTKKYISQSIGVDCRLMMQHVFLVLRDLLFSRSMFDNSIMSIFFTTHALFLLPVKPHARIPEHTNDDIV